MPEIYLNDVAYNNLIDWIVNLAKVTASQPAETLATPDAELANIAKHQLGKCCDIWPEVVRPHNVDAAIKQAIASASPFAFAGSKPALDLDKTGELDPDGVEFIDADDDRMARLLDYKSKPQERHIIFIAAPFFSLKSIIYIKWLGDLDSNQD